MYSGDVETVTRSYSQKLLLDRRAMGLISYFYCYFIVLPVGFSRILPLFARAKTHLKWFLAQSFAYSAQRHIQLCGI